jgi:phosphoribosyl 1,2-cyclic phosphodiesterase
MLKIFSIASGSSGNCIYAGSDSTHILVDAGISGKRINEGLSAMGISPAQISAILVTHEHTDHIKGLGVMSRKYRIPIYASELTWNKIRESTFCGVIDETLFNRIVPDNDFVINDIIIHPFRTQHDAVEPLCYTLSKDGRKISVATDLGCYNEYILGNIAGSDILFIEANHDIEMLQNGSYPGFLKKRILGEKGHLSNNTTVKLISEICHEKLKCIVLGHLSRENNDPRIAHDSVKVEIDSFNLKTGLEVKLAVAEREKSTELFCTG